MDVGNKVLVMILTYNEEENISRVIGGVKKHVPLADIVVIDGESRDSTVEQARQCGVFVLEVPHRLGIGGGVETGYKFAEEMGYDILARVDGDGQHNPEALPKLIKSVIDGRADVVIGSRYAQATGYRASLSRAVGIKLFSLLLSALSHQKITDPTSGFQAVNRDVIRFFAVDCHCNWSEVEAIVLLHQAGFSIHELPVIMNERLRGESSFKLGRAFFYMFKGLLSLFVGCLRESPRRRC